MQRRQQLVGVLARPWFARLVIAATGLVSHLASFSGSAFAARSPQSLSHPYRRQLRRIPTYSYPIPTINYRVIKSGDWANAKATISVGWWATTSTASCR